jgi:hypothetical protein
MLLLLFLPADMGIAQSSAPAFWELRPERADAMLLQVPDGDDRRYAHLREYFADLHCTSKLMEEQTIPKHIRKNLMCVLPGKDSERILVAARYERRRDITGEGWSEAVMLPMLYNALQAQPRQHTFIFVELDGSAGEKEFIDGVRNNHRQPPKAIVVLDSLGLTAPRFYTVPASLVSAKGRERTARNKLLESEAFFAAHLLGIPMEEPPSPIAVANTLLFRADKIPSILVYSDFNKKVSAPAFHEEFDFVAYFLCRIDNKLAGLPSSSTQ